MPNQMGDGIETKMMVSFCQNGKVTWILLTSMVLLEHVRALQAGAIVANVQEIK